LHRAHQTTDFPTFGMGFATKGVGPDEDLYIASTAESLLGKIDVSGTFGLTNVGLFNPALLNAELTGTGDGRLYGFFTTIPEATLAKIEKSSASTSENRALDGVSTGSAWAFSFWGGDFWFYTSFGEPSSVTRLHAQTGEIEVVKQDVGGFRIVGAGVSTCAPLTSGPR
jgi:hypothetical protein